MDDGVLRALKQLFTLPPVGAPKKSTYPKQHKNLREIARRQRQIARGLISPLFTNSGAQIK